MEDAEKVAVGVDEATGTITLYRRGRPDTRVNSSVRSMAERGGFSFKYVERKHNRDELHDVAMRITANGRTLAAESEAQIESVAEVTEDFDGITVSANVRNADKKPVFESAIRRMAKAVPVRFVYGDRIRPLGSRINDSSPYNGGLYMRSTGAMTRCSTGFGAVYGRTPAILTARHCPGPWTEFGTSTAVGSVSLNSNQGVGMIPTAGSALVFTGAWNADPSPTRTVSQRDPNNQVIGTMVCNEGGNSGERCYLRIDQLGVWINDGFGSIYTQRASNIYGDIAASGGDSGGPVISLHTNNRAWAVGIVQATNVSRTQGCPAREPNVQCGVTLYFTDVDRMLSGFSGMALKVG